MQHSNKKPVGSQDQRPANDTTSDARRRLGRIVHDERGNAIVEWEDAPPDYQRPVLEIESSDADRDLQRRLGADRLALDNPHDFDPYSSTRPLERKPPRSTGNTSRTDLRKLSEWIKLMREMEQRKQPGAADTDEDAQ